MCGICGFVDPARSTGAEELRETARAMALAIAHRGPDDAGAWSDPEAGVAFGHRRLSILDLSPEGHQPMASASGRLVIAYNGEVYNHGELRRELLSLGHSFRGRSDTEVMLEAVERWGLERTLRRMNGMFAFSLWDARERTLWLARDRMGKKPLYYGFAGGVFVFGSELKALRRHPAFRGEVDREAVTAYLRHGYVPAPLTIYRGIRKLMPGTFLRVPLEGGEAQPVAYWDAREAAAAGMRDPSRAPREELEREMEALLRDAVAVRMEADVPLGAFLSGGIDSSLVTALMQAQSASPVRTFSIGFREPGYDEAEHAAAVAAHLGTEHTGLYVSAADALALVPELPQAYDEPFGDASAIPTLLLSRLTREHVTVALSGDGGDELFAGYSRYHSAARLWRRVVRVPPTFRLAAARALEAVPGGGWSALSRAYAGAEGRARQAGAVMAAPGPERFYTALTSQWPDPAGMVVGGAEPRALADRLAAPAGEHRIHRWMQMDVLGYLPDDVLVKVDRATMAASLEARAPLLDYRVAELAWRIPLDANVGAGVGKQMLRSILFRHVPRALVERPKRGFAAPVDVWMRGPLRDWAEDLLSPERIARDGLLRAEPVRRRWREHVAGRANWRDSLWLVLMLQAWLQAQR